MTSRSWPSWLTNGHSTSSSTAFSPFDRIADAFAYLEQGRAKGKIIVQMV
jgi:hypothetical protein